jgi:anti-anti-sigma regulatory factor
MLVFELIKLDDKTYLLKLNSKIVSSGDSYDFAKELTHIKDLEDCSLIIDVSQVNYTPSTFWSRVIMFSQKMKKVVLVGLKGSNKKAFEVLGIDKLAFSAGTVAKARDLINN